MIDQLSVSLITAVVVLMCGVLFLFDTLVRRPELSGRLWAVGFLSAVMTTTFYLVWAAAPATDWAVVLGNAAFVLGNGAMWLGCRAYNKLRVLWPGVFVGIITVAMAVVAAIELSRGGDDWSGAWLMFGALLLFAAAASAECFRRDLGSTLTALPLGLVFGFQAAFYAARIVVSTTFGFGETFDAWVGTIQASVLTVVLLITALVTASVLRAGRAALRGSIGGEDEAGSVGTVLRETAFRRALTAIVETASGRRELVAVSVIELDGLEFIATAFGLDVRDDVIRTWRSTMTENAPTLAVIGEAGAERLAMVTVVPSPAEARRQAMALYRSLFEALAAVEGGVLPAIGIGVALTDVGGYDADALTEAASSAAVRAASGVASAVLLVEPV